MPPRTMTIKVSQGEYELIQQARDKLRLKGLERVGINDEQVKEFNWEDFALGAVVGISALLLLEYLSKSK